MYPSQYITQVATPKVNETNVGQIAVAGVFNGVDEYVDIYNSDYVKMLNSESFDGHSDWLVTTPNTTSGRWHFSIWYKPTALRNDNQDDKVIFHNGLAGNDAFKVLIPDNTENIRIFIGDGDDGGENKVLTQNNFAKVGSWCHVYYEFTSNTTGEEGVYRKRIKPRAGIPTANYVSYPKVTIQDIYTNNNTDDHITIGCYREGLSGTPANFFVGEIGQVTVVKNYIAYDTFYNLGLGYDFTNPGYIVPDDLIMDFHFGDGTWMGSRRHGGRDGDDNLILFDSSKSKEDARTDRSGGKLVFGSHAAGDWTLSNSTWAVDGSGVLRRTGGTSTSSATAQFDAFTPVVGRLYKVDYAFTVTTASGDVADTLTFAGTTISSTTGVGVNAGNKWVKASNTNKLVLTAGSDSDSRTTMNLGTIYIWEYDRYGIMVNMTQADNITRTGPSTKFKS